MKHYDNSIFLDYDTSRNTKARKIKQFSILASIIIGLFLLFYGVFYFISNSSLNNTIRDKEYSSILYSDTENWNESIYDATNNEIVPSISPDKPENAAAANAPTPTPNPKEEQIGVSQQETSLVTPEPLVTRPPITEGLFKTKTANYTENDIIVTDSSYYSPTMSIELYNFYMYESKIFVADIFIKSLDNFSPVFANGEFHDGYQTTSEMAEEHNAVLAINSDSVTACEHGIVVRYGEIYRDILAGDHMAVFNTGIINTYPGRNISAEFLIKRGAEHVFCFGPKLLDDDGTATTFDYSEYAHNRKKNPRTAIGMIAPYHYVIVVADGREDGYSEGLTLEELSQLMYDLNCLEAYNLDGGGSSTMVFMNKLVNRPEGNTEEREIDSAILFVETFE